MSLDGRPVRTPGGARFVVPTRPIAAAVAEEWDAQTDRVDPRTMALFGLACSGIDRIGADRCGVVAMVAAYAETDLLCYRADHPPALAARQTAVWQPLLDWATLHFDAPLTVTAGVVPVAQPAPTLTALRRAVEAFEDLSLAALGAATTASGSVILGLALAEGRIDADGAFEAAHLDETFQMEQWGEDPEAAARRERIRGDIRAAAQFLELVTS